jgi:DNA-directed RNA polymerase specialized sigma24 family protein
MVRKISFIKVSEAESEKLDSALKTALKIGGHRYRLKIAVINLSHEGWTVKNIARHFQIPERTVWKWRRIYKEKGIDGLRGKYFSHRL